MTTTPAITQLIPHSAQQERDSSPEADPLFGDDGPGFDDLIDMVNPLQHIPGVSQAYQAMTGDLPSLASSVIGGGIFGGAIGAAASAVTAIVEEGMGESLTGRAGTLLAEFTGADDPQTQMDALYGRLPSDQLESDEGQALVAMIRSGAFAPQKRSSVGGEGEAVGGSLQNSAALSLRSYQDDAMGLSDTQKQRQFVADMQKQFLKSL